MHFPAKGQCGDHRKLRREQRFWTAQSKAKFVQSLARGCILLDSSLISEIEPDSRKWRS
jgi:hypothetical protein